MKRNRNIGSILLIAAGLLLIAAALYELIPVLLAYKRADDTYEALREAYMTGQPGTSSDDPAEEGEELPAWYEALQVDFETLKEANPDVIGWIYFDNIEQIHADPDADLGIRAGCGRTLPGHGAGGPGLADRVC